MRHTRIVVTRYGGPDMSSITKRIREKGGTFPVGKVPSQKIKDLLDP
jgi:hypothetical protein